MTHLNGTDNTSPNGTMNGTRVFPQASVIQLVDDRATPDAMVVSLHEATVTVSPDGIAAGDGALDWSWSADELLDVIHGAAEPWTIFVVPEVSEFGVSVAAHHRDEFRRAIAELFTPPVVEPPVVEPVETIPSPFEPPVVAPSVVELVETTTTTTPVGARPVVVSTRSITRSPDPVFAPPVIEEPETFELPRIEVRDDWSEPPPATMVPAGNGQGALAGLDAREISAWFGTHQVLDRVSLSMRAGEVTALIGPSGCGKSTFLRILNRMHEMIPSAQMAGEVLLDGHDIYDPQRKLTAARREIGMVFQKPNPFPAMSIYDNVIASLRLTGTRATQVEKDQLVESCLKKAGLWLEVKDRLRQPGGGLSGGQQQRLCIARALAIKPRVLLMDEPCSALDPTSTRRIEQTIGDLVHEVTIVIVTHNMQQAARVSNRCAFFLAEQGTPGLIVEHGPTDLMFGSPQDPRTDDYVNGRFG